MNNHSQIAEKTDVNIAYLKGIVKEGLIEVVKTWLQIDSLV